MTDADRAAPRERGVRGSAGTRSGRKRPGMMDVARAAGVSHQTVSRVINDPDSVRPATLVKVRAVIAELGYRPNVAARALVTDLMRLVGVVTTSSGFTGPASTSAAIELVARRAEYGTLVTALQETDQREVEDAFSFLTGRGVDGIIVVAPREIVAEATRQVARCMPLVVVADGLEPNERMHVIGVDQALGARMLVRHLVATGRRTIAYVAGPLDWFDAARRVAGWRGALEDVGMEPGMLVQGDWSAESGYAALASLLAAGADHVPDAVFCSNDLMALGLMAAARDQGIEVPGELAVVGFDDVAGAAYFRPPLTTVRQPFEEVGRVCMEVLLRAM